jgi:cyclopropane fatty-acyl-phospholipid synthase-like methyltransferase
VTRRDEIEAYWESGNTVSLLDSNLRMLEESTVLRYLHKNMEFADLGCGGGQSTVRYAAAVKSCLALEQSSHLRANAKALFDQAKLTNVELVAGSVSDLSKYIGRFDGVLTQRVVINFLSWEEQKHVIEQVRATLKPGGLYVMIENTYEGAENLNAVRRQVGLDNIPVHWHNYFLHYPLLMDFLKDKFVLEKVHTFDLYYLLTRVFENMLGKFEGYGANAKFDDIFKIADPAARKLFEALGERLSIKVPAGNSFGPIQAFILRKIG